MEQELTRYRKIYDTNVTQPAAGGTVIFAGRAIRDTTLTGTRLTQKTSLNLDQNHQQPGSLNG